MAYFLILPLPLLMLLIPIVFQIIMGRIKRRKKLKISLGLVTLISVVLEIVMTILVFPISIKGQGMAHVGSMSPGVIGFGFWGVVIILIISIAQLVRKE